MQYHGFIRERFPLHSELRAVGNKVTVRISHMDPTTVHKVFDIIKSGDILAISMNKDYQRTPFGELVCHMAKYAKVGGVIIDSAITDAHAIRELGVHVFYRQVSVLTISIRALKALLMSLLL